MTTANIPEIATETLFKVIDSQTYKKYKSHLAIKGESWRDCSIDSLLAKLVEEYKETIEAFYPASDSKLQSQYAEVIDLIVVSRMLAARLVMLGIETKKKVFQE
jgi:hypothetical protein